MALSHLYQLNKLREVLSIIFLIHLKVLNCVFGKVHPEMAEKALSVMRRHLEVLAGPLTVLSLADTNLPQESREAVGKKLVDLQHEWNPGAMPLKRASAPEDLVSPEGIIGEDWHEVY